MYLWHNQLTLIASNQITQKSSVDKTQRSTVYPCQDLVVFYEFFMWVYVVSAPCCIKWHLQTGRSHVFFLRNNVKPLSFLVKSS